MLPVCETSRIVQYLTDESNAFVASPETVSGVFFPESEAELIDILRSSEEPVTVSGAGTGLTGARVPMLGGTVISTERMRRTVDNGTGISLERDSPAGAVRIHLDESRQHARVAPGITLAELDTVLPKDLSYGPDPTERLASLGGTVATNASGARCFYFGPTRSWIDGLRVVLADGDVLVLRRGACAADRDGMLRFRSESGKEYCVKIPNYRMPQVKNAAGLYSKDGMDLIDLFIGSEGILGIFSEITVKLQPAESDIVADLAFFRSEADAQEAVGRLRAVKERGILAIEYFNGNALDFIRDQYPEMPHNARAAVLAELKSDGLKNMDFLADLLKKHGVLEDWCANNPFDRRKMKEFRHSLPDSINSFLKQHDSHKLATDIAVPVAEFPAMMDRYAETGCRFAEKYPREGKHWVLYGHVGDCHAHFNFITASEDERRFARTLIAELAEFAVSVGGTLSAEHGVGKKTLLIGGKNVPYLQLMYGVSGLREIARVKKALDPGTRLNAGNMVPGNY
ncbi:MAG: FAD-binding oxidoreductase [Thermoplasmata archaeon]|nr:FAD-binding oxidoreductase [Thermoplasmata archaeon]